MARKNKNFFASSIFAAAGRLGTAARSWEPKAAASSDSDSNLAGFGRPGMRGCGLPAALPRFQPLSLPKPRSRCAVPAPGPGRSWRSKISGSHLGCLCESFIAGSRLSSPLDIAGSLRHHRPSSGSFVPRVPHEAFPVRSRLALPRLTVFARFDPPRALLSHTRRPVRPTSIPTPDPHSPSPDLPTSRVEPPELRGWTARVAATRHEIWRGLRGSLGAGMESQYGAPPARRPQRWTTVLKLVAR